MISYHGKAAAVAQMHLRHHQPHHHYWPHHVPQQHHHHHHQAHPIPSAPHSQPMHLHQSEPHFSPRFSPPSIVDSVVAGTSASVSSSYRMTPPLRNTDSPYDDMPLPLIKLKSKPLEETHVASAESGRHPSSELTKPGVPMATQTEAEENSGENGSAKNACQHPMVDIPFDFDRSWVGSICGVGPMKV